MENLVNGANIDSTYGTKEIDWQGLQPVRIENTVRSLKRECQIALKKCNVVRDHCTIKIKKKTSSRFHYKKMTK